MKIRALTLLLLAFSALLFSQYKPWFNYYNFAYGTKARATGNAFVAVADDLTAAFWNPAGLAAKRVPEFYLCYKYHSQKHYYDLQDRILLLETKLYNYNFSGRLNQIDFFSVSAPAVIWQRNWTFALSYYRYIPYGLKGTLQEVLTYLHDRYNPQKTIATFSGSEGMDVLAFSLSVAATKQFALGGTLQQFFGSGFQHISTVDPGGEFHKQYTEKLQGRNVIAGLLFSPFDFLRLGCTWHSGLRSRFDSMLRTWEVNRRGNKINQQEASCLAEVAIPQQVALGAMLRPASWLDLSAEYSRLDWGRGTVAGYYDNAVVLPYPQKNDWAQEQRDIRNLRFGGEVRLPLRRWQLHLRAGWSADRQLFADAKDRDVLIRGVAAGIGCEFSQNLLLEIAYQRQTADWPEDSFFNNEPDVATHYRDNLFSLSLTYRFGHIFKE